MSGLWRGTLDAQGVPSTNLVPAPVLSAALFDRFSSRGEDDFADKFCRRFATSSAVTKRDRDRRGPLYVLVRTTFKACSLAALPKVS
jgi:hypothetical protein